MKEQYSLKIYFQSYPDRIASQIIRMYSDSSLSSSSPGLGAEIFTKTIMKNDFTVTINFFHEPILGLTSEQARKQFSRTSAALIFFNKDTRKSFQKIPEILGTLKQYISQDIAIFIVGIISDFEAVTYERGEKLANRLGGRYFEISMENFTQLDQIINSLIHRYIALTIPISITGHPDSIATDLIQVYANQSLDDDISVPGRSTFIKQVDPSTKLYFNQISSAMNQNSFYKEFLAGIFIYSKTSRESFEKIKKNYQNFLNQSSRNVHVVFLAINEGVEKVSTEEGLNLETENTEYFELKPNDHKFFSKIMNTLIHKLKYSSNL
ncbi:MAG: hypothetical protein ACFE95_18245 [Candidatus Hodarchaeota archaeon]